MKTNKICQLDSYEKCYDIICIRNSAHVLLFLVVHKQALQEVVVGRR